LHKQDVLEIPSGKEEPNITINQLWTIWTFDLLPLFDWFT